jgi:hypothetical protein
MRTPDRRPSGVVAALTRMPASGLAAEGARPGRLDWPALGLRALGALALLAGGAVHLEQLVAATFWVIPVIGPLFALNFAGSLVVGLALLSPVERLPGRWATLVPALLAAAAVAIAAVGLGFLLASEVIPIFGFHESNFRSEVIAAIAADIATIVLLGGFVATQRRSV